MAVMSTAQTRPATPSGDIIVGNPAKDTDKDVGDIYIWRESGFPETLFVELQIVDNTPEDILDNWLISHVYVDIGLYPGLTGIPQAKGNPIPGHFSFKEAVEHETSYRLAIDLNDPALSSMGIFPTTSPIAVAVHASVCQGGLDVLKYAMPTDFQVRVMDDDPPRLSYFPIVEIQNDTWLNGIYYDVGWCADRDHGILAEYGWVHANAYSSYDLPLPLGIDGENIIDYPENLDIVNWLLNQNFVGKLCLAPDGITDLGYGTITFVDVQVAIWKLLDDEPGWPETFDPYSQDRVTYMMNLANAHDGYKPGCNEKLWVIIASDYLPTMPWQLQTLLIPVPIPCEECKTAWAAVWDGEAYQYPFPGKNWATYLLFYWPIY